MRIRIAQRNGNRLGHVVDVGQLQLCLGCEDRDHREELDDLGEHVDEIVILSEHDRRAQDGRFRERLEHQPFAKGLGLRILRLSVRIGGAGADLDETMRARFAGRFRQIAGRLAHQKLQIAVERPDQVDDGMGTFDDLFDAMVVEDIGTRELQLAQIGERLERKSLFGIAAGDPEPRPFVQQRLCDVLPKKAAAAEQDDQFVRKGTGHVP